MRNRVKKKITESLFVYKCNIRAYKKADFVFENSTNCCEREREWDRRYAVKSLQYQIEIDKLQNFSFF